MNWTATAVWTAAGLTSDQVADVAVDLDGGAVYDAATGVLRVTYEVAGATRKEAMVVACDRAGRILLSSAVESVTVQAHPLTSSGQAGRSSP
jgi:hypothetical protein